MNNPFSSNAPQDPVPPLSEQTGAVERETAEEAAARARESRRLASAGGGHDCCNVPACCQSMTRFVKEHPCVSVGLAFALGILAGRCAAIEH